VEKGEEVRRRLGAVLSRRMSSASSEGAGSINATERRVIKFDTAFEALAEAVETVTLRREADGQWRVTGYLIRPKGFDENARQRRLSQSSSGHGIVPPPQEPLEGRSPQQLLYNAMGFRSRWSLRFLSLAWLGFLGFLGAIPGLERMWGFTGFFGFIGVATFIELFHRGKDGKYHPAMRTWWHKALVSALLAVIIAVPVHMFLLELFVLKGDSASPELPKGSRVLVWKQPRSFSAGDMIIYRDGDLALAGRVVKVSDSELIVQRNNSSDITVPRSKLVGKVIMQTRGGGEGEMSPAVGVAPAKSAALTTIPRKVEKWQNEVPFTGDPQLRYIAWLPTKASDELSLWTPDGSKQQAHGDIPDRAWTWWMKHILNPNDERRPVGKDASPSGQRLLFFLSHPAIDEASESRVHLFNPQGTEIELKSWSFAHHEPKSPGSNGWIVMLYPLPEEPGAGPFKVRLQLTAGTWRISETFPVGFWGGHGFGGITMGGNGEDQDHHAFVNVQTDEKFGVPQWNAFAKLKDGTVVGFDSANAFYMEGRETHTVHFVQSLSELSGFFLRWREPKITEFKDVKLPPLPNR
jgi:signal peptidase I